MAKKLKIAIIGIGAVGGFLADKLTLSGFEVICIPRKNRVSFYNKIGLKIESMIFGSSEVHPRFKKSVDEPIDIIFITTKSNGFKKALSVISSKAIKSNTIIIPFLNGIDHMELLHKKFPKNSASGTISIEVFRDNNGTIKHTSKILNIVIACDNHLLLKPLQLTAEALKKSGFNVEIGKSENEILWKKLVRLSAVALSTTLTNKPVGWIRKNKIFQQRLKNIVTEAVFTANADGVKNIKIEKVMEQINIIHPSQLSSLQRDIAKNKPSELDAIAGAIVRKAKKHRIKC